MIEFVQGQVGILLWWIVRALLIAYAASWALASLVEWNIVDPLWILGG